MSLSFKQVHMLVKDAARKHDWTITNSLTVTVQFGYKKQAKDLYIISYEMSPFIQDPDSAVYQRALSAAYETLQMTFAAAVATDKDQTFDSPTSLSSRIDIGGIDMTYIFSTMAPINLEEASRLIAVAAAGFSAIHDVRGRGYGSFDIRSIHGRVADGRLDRNGRA